MKNTQIGLCKEFPYEIRDNNVYCSTLCRNGEWERSPSEKDVKAFRTQESAKKHITNKRLWLAHAVIPYKEWESE